MIKKIPLKELLEVADSGTWGTISDTPDSQPVLRSSNIKGNKLIFENSAFVLIPEKDKDRKLLIENDIIVTKSSGSPELIGKCAIYNKVTKNSRHYFSNFMLRLRTKNEILIAKWLFYFLVSPIGKSLITQMNNTTSGLRNLNINLYLSQLIPVPTINVQESQVAKLDKVDYMIQKRKKAIKLLDEYLRSVFYDMFGDPVKNEKGWEKFEFGRIIKSIRYGTGSPPIYSENGIPFIRATNIKMGTVIEKDMKFISEVEANKISKCRLDEGDLIIVRSGINSGDCAYINKKYSRSYAGFDLIIQIVYPYNIYYNYFINSIYGKAILKPLSRRAGQPHLNADQVKGIEVIKPSDNLLTKFAQIVEQVEKTKAKMQESLKEMDNLFNSLMQQAFKG